MSPEEAEMCARNDAHGIFLDANIFAADLAPGERTILVDGSHIAPSWRRLDGGARVWDDPDFDPGDGLGLDIVEAYDEELERLLRDWQSPNGAFLAWDEGCLYVERAPAERARIVAKTRIDRPRAVRYMEVADGIHSPDCEHVYDYMAFHCTRMWPSVEAVSN